MEKAKKYTDFTQFSSNKHASEVYNNFGSSIEGRRWYQHDIDQIVYSTYFRKLQRKYQLLSDKDPRCRSRMVHTLEVSRIAKEISEKLGLNVELTEGIALAHDIGNTAFGAISNNILFNKTKGAFQHEEAGYLMLKYICKKEVTNNAIKNNIINATIKSKNEVTTLHIKEYYPYEFEVYRSDGVVYYTCICQEILDGVRKHGTNDTAYTLEGQVVNFADNIAYLSQDIDDLISTGMLGGEKISEFIALKESSLQIGGKEFDWDIINKNTDVDLRNVFSQSSSERIGTLIKRFVSHNQTRELTKADMMNSPLLGMEIPVLEIDQGLKLVIDYLWQYTSDFYSESLIKNFNIEVESRMEILWNILSDVMFQKMNEGYRDFYRRYNSPVFVSFFNKKKWDNVDQLENWKKAYFVAALSSDEIDTIINMYQQRDYTFHLDL